MWALSFAVSAEIPTLLGGKKCGTVKIRTVKIYRHKNSERILTFILPFVTLFEELNNLGNVQQNLINWVQGKIFLQCSLLTVMTFLFVAIRGKLFVLIRNCWRSKIWVMNTCSGSSPPGMRVPSLEQKQYGSWHSDRSHFVAKSNGASVIGAIAVGCTMH